MDMAQMDLAPPGWPLLLPGDRAIA